MADSFTANYNLTKPEVGASRDTWGQKLNDNMTAVDLQMKANANAAIAAQTTANAAQTTANSATTTANAALPKAGGTMTGSLTLNAAPTADLGAATKAYVDGADATNAAAATAAQTTANTANVRATAAEYRAGAVGTAPRVDYIWSAAAPVALTDGATVNIDLSSGINFTLTIAGNRTLANPTNTKPGQAGLIVVTQDATGGRTLAFGNSFKFANGVAPSPDTTANYVNVYSYFVVSSSFIVLTMQRGVR